MVIEQVVVLFDNIGNFCRGKAFCQYFGLRLDFLHEIAVLVHNFPDLPLQIRPNLLLILNDVLCLVQLSFQILNLILELTLSIVFILLEVCQHLLEDQDLRLSFVSLLRNLIDLS